MLRRTTGIVMVSSLFISGKEDAANARGHYTIDKEIVDLVLNRLLAQIISIDGHSSLRRSAECGRH